MRWSQDDQAGPAFLWCIRFIGCCSSGEEWIHLACQSQLWTSSGKSKKSVHHLSMKEGRAISSMLKIGASGTEMCNKHFRVTQGILKVSCSFLLSKLTVFLGDPSKPCLEDVSLFANSKSEMVWMETAGNTGTQLQALFALKILIWLSSVDT